MSHASARRGAVLALALLPTLVLALAGMGCRGSEPGVPVPGHEGATKTAAVERAERRLYDGAPPVIPHPSFGAACITCHNVEGRSVPEVGFAPPSPHEMTLGMSALSNCRQCHVFQLADKPWRDSTFAGLRQDLRRGRRLNQLAPPVIPHRILMRENCQACHDGPAAREEIRTSHPERSRCQQCHLEQKSTGAFEPAAC